MIILYNIVCVQRLVVIMYELKRHQYLIFSFFPSAKSTWAFAKAQEFFYLLMKPRLMKLSPFIKCRLTQNCGLQKVKIAVESFLKSFLWVYSLN